MLGDGEWNSDRATARLRISRRYQASRSVTNGSRFSIIGSDVRHTRATCGDGGLPTQCGFVFWRPAAEDRRAAAESLSKHQGDLSFWGLTELSYSGAKSLSMHQGDLELELSELPEVAHEVLRHEHASFKGQGEDED